MDPQLKDALAVEGYLGKQSPGIFHNYQQRYCRFMDGGLTLGYSDSKDHFDHHKINGQIALKDVIKVLSDEKPNKFQLEVEGRIYKFEAKNPDEKATWVKAINICIEHAVKHHEKAQEQIMAIDSDIRYEESNARESSQSIASVLNPFGLAKKIVVDTVMNTGINLVKKAVKTEKKNYPNEDYLKAKNLSEALAAIPAEVLRSRLMMGYIWKESKEATGVGLVDGFVNDAGIRDLISRRWCMIVSSKPIIFSEVDPSDEETLLSGRLPIEVEEETMYFFDDNVDDSKPLEVVPVKDVIDILVRKKDTNEQFYRFVLDLGEKKINLLWDDHTQMMTWLAAVQTAKANLKEKTRSKLPIVKNLYWHFKIISDPAQGENALKDKMNADYDKLVPSGEMKGDDVDGMIKLQQKVADEFITIVNACLAHKDTRTDVIKVAISVYHESIMSALRAYFKKHQAKIDSRDIFEIMKFMIWYRDRLNLFGDAFVDPKIPQGITTLSKIVSTRMLKNNLVTVKNIVKQDMDKEPTVNDGGQYVTDAGTDVFRTLNETFENFRFCNTKELALALLDTCRMTLDYFKAGLGTILDYYKTTPEQLAAFCNNTVNYNANIKQFSKHAEEQLQIPGLTVSQHFDEKALAKAFIGQGKKAYEKIAYLVFLPLSEEWNKMSFFDIDLEKSVNPVLEKVTQLEEKMHKNFGSKVEAACLEKAVTFYVQAFLVSAEKKRFKPEEYQKIVTKLEDDIRVFGDIFQNLKKTMIENYTKSISNVLDFLSSRYDMLPLAVQNLKESYGTALKWATIEMVIKLRNDDLDKAHKAELLKDCEDVYKTTDKKAEKAANFNVFKHVDQAVGGAIDTGLALKHTESENYSEDSLSETASSSSRRESYTFGKPRQSALNMEGYLDVEKDEFLSNVGATLIATNLKFENKYFNLKRDVLYYYKDKSAESAQGSYKLKEMTDFGAEENQDKMFFIRLTSAKDGTVTNIRFIAPKPEIRTSWLTALKQAKELPDYDAMVELHASDIVLFTDFKPLFADIEEMPDMVFPPAPSPPPPKIQIFTKKPVEPVAPPKTVDTSLDETVNVPRKRSFHLEEPVLPSLNTTGRGRKCCDTCNMF